MPENSLAVVRAIYDAFARGDFETIFGLVHPEVELYQSSRLPWGASTGGMKASESSSRSWPGPSSRT